MKSKNYIISISRLVLVCLIWAQTPLATAQEFDRDIRLVLQLTVDGLRADLLSRYADRFGEGGFAYLKQNGTVFANAHYQHANTETIVGHSTLATGAQPSVHGMTGNVWLDTETGELAYNIEDAEFPLLPSRDRVTSGEQVDPAQKLARSQGRSPRALLAETLTDKLNTYTAGKARIFAVSGKDRGAVALAGKAGKAFWMSTNSGDFITSTYYYETYPEWVTQWNAQRKAESLAASQWQLLNNSNTYLLAHQDDRPYETDLRGYGRVFPHQFGNADNKLLYTQVVASPYGDKLTADFARQLLVNEKLGRDNIPDYLSVSFSGVDVVNHFFGPSSLENEDMILQLDRTLADLFQFIDDQVGMQHVLIVLSADHGMAELPEYMSEQGMDAGRLTTDMVTSMATQAGKDLFSHDKLVRFYYRPFVYLDQDALQKAGLDRQEVANAIATRLTHEVGIHLAITPGEVNTAAVSSLITRVANNIHPVRSGDIYIVQDPYWFNFDKGPVAAMHGSPWRYDTHVPVIFAGTGVPSNTVYREVQPADVAPTLAALLGMSPPASAQGKVLPEVFETKSNTR